VMSDKRGGWGAIGGGVEVEGRRGGSMSGIVPVDCASTGTHGESGSLHPLDCTPQRVIDSETVLGVVGKDGWRTNDDYFQ
jgi:hypothetical protein